MAQLDLNEIFDQVREPRPILGQRRQRNPQQNVGKGYHPVYNKRVLPKYFSMTPWERKFKLAACELVLEHTYPSGRQILARALGPDHHRLKRRPHLNGREGHWKGQVFSLFGLEPSTYGMSKRWYA